MQFQLKAAAISAAILAACPAAAQQSGAEGNWLVRARAVNLDMANKSAPIPSLSVPTDAIHVSDKTIPELDVSYFFTRNLATELVLTVPQKHDVSLSGSKIGTFRHLPPTLTLQWHFNPEGTFRPYVGAGVNYTLISSENIHAAGLNLRLENDSWGGALQAGFDVQLSKQTFLNVDVKKVQIRSDLYADGVGKVSHLKLDPLLIGVGLGYRF